MRLEHPWPSAFSSTPPDEEQGERSGCMLLPSYRLIIVIPESPGDRHEREDRREN